MFRPHEFPDTRASLLAVLRECESGSPGGWREFYQRYAPAVYRVCRMRGFKSHDCEDILQTVMVTVAQHIRTFQYEKQRGKFRNWVRQITESRIVDFVRRQRTREKPCDEILRHTMDASPTPAEIWDQQWLLQDIHYCLDKLARETAPRRIEAFKMYVLDGVSADETAKRLGMTRGHVYVIRTLLLKAIREQISRLDAADDEGGDAIDRQSHRSP